jgi:hypothetical protein
MAHAEARGRGVGGEAGWPICRLQSARKTGREFEKFSRKGGWVVLGVWGVGSGVRCHAAGDAAAGSNPGSGTRAVNYFFESSPARESHWRRKTSTLG